MKNRFFNLIEYATVPIPSYVHCSSLAPLSAPRGSLKDVEAGGSLVKVRSAIYFYITFAASGTVVSDRALVFWAAKMH